MWSFEFYDVVQVMGDNWDEKVEHRCGKEGSILMCLCSTFGIMVCRGRNYYNNNTMTKCAPVNTEAKLILVWGFWM